MAEMDNYRWDRLSSLFDRLMVSGDPEAVLASETDVEIRTLARNLWLHHVESDRENYLSAPLEFEVTPCFQAGQKLLDRFRIEKQLGSGGMGEVYLAWDERMEGLVALKTIARLLSHSKPIRRRFVAEVQNARRVTHPNVCRIHELFEDGEIVFFTMEYVEGPLLADVIGNEGVVGHSKAIVLQLAQALHAAHRTGVVHGDFKPANVIVTGLGSTAEKQPRAVITDFGLARALDRALGPAEEGLSVQAGTGDYMAPELRAGEAPTVRSDIFAFAQVASRLLPREAIWQRCIQSTPADRPESLAPVIEVLEPKVSRRYWIIGTAIASAVAARYAFIARTAPGIGLPADSRILVNGFGADLDQSDGARLLRSLVLTSLRQSPRVQSISDQDLLPALQRLSPGSALPLSGQILRTLLAQLRAAFWIDGDLRRNGGRYALDLRVLAASGARLIGASTFRDEPTVLSLAKAVALWVRTAAGESSQSLAINAADVARYTSTVPEALQKYYDAMDRYALGDVKLAVPLLEEAVRLDPSFAQAHKALALVYNSVRAYSEAFREIETASRLAKALPPRERTPIETAWYRMTEDHGRMVQSATQELAYFPGDPRSYFDLGRTLADSGKLVDAIAKYRSGLSMAPDDLPQVASLESAMVESLQFDAAVSEFRVAASKDPSSRWIYDGYGAALLGLERYAEAIEAFSKTPQGPGEIFNRQKAGILQGRLEIAVAEMEQQLGRVSNPIEIFRANEFLCGLNFALDRTDAARRYPPRMADLPVFPLMARYLGGAASWARRLNDGQSLDAVLRSAREISHRWPNAQTDSVVAHAEGLKLWLDNSPDQAAARLLDSAGPAFGVWPVFDLAELYSGRAKWNLAEEYWKKFEALRGAVIVRGWFPGSIVLAWLNRAIVAQMRNDRASAFHWSKKILDHWAAENPGLRIVQSAQRINAVSKPL
jgi:serine/threonine protein kinase/tetratricopeptide (TPR) repeat protein